MNLLPNIFRKDLRGMGDPLTVSISINCLSRLCNEDLAQMLYKDMLPLYTASKCLIRRKVCILSFKMFVNCPDAIPELLPYLCDRLKDSKTGV
jgi:AP-3 complex subunit delta-1